MSHPLRKECVDGEVKLMRYEDISYTHSADGFYTYHCSAFVIDDPDEVNKLLDRFREHSGAKMFARMDYVIVVHRDQRLMLVKYPPCMLRHMLAPSGGQMKTGLIGPRDALDELPTLVKTGALANAQEYMDGRYGVVVETEYGEGYLPLAERMHWDIVREVIAHPGRCLTVCPVGAWEP